jgi:hypothetical protein
MKFRIRIAESDKMISEKIGNALIPEARKYMKKNMDNVKKSLPAKIYSIIVSSPEYSSILGGRLKYEFGIPDPAAKLDGLLSIWTNNVYVVYTPPSVISGGRIVSSFSVSMIKSDFSDVLGSNYAFVYDNKRGYTLPWLEWLLLEGSVSLVKNHSVVMQANPRSRTGMALMKVSNSSWKVPNQYAGTISDNWITRSLEAANDDIYNLIKKAMTL